MFLSARTKQAKSSFRKGGAFSLRFLKEVRRTSLRRPCAGSPKGFPHNGLAFRFKRAASPLSRFYGPCRARRRKLHIPCFRLKPKASSLRCSSFPMQTRYAGLCMGAQRRTLSGRKVYFPRRMSSENMKFEFISRQLCCAKLCEAFLWLFCCGEGC